MPDATTSPRLYSCITFYQLFLALVLAWREYQESGLPAGIVLGEDTRETLPAILSAAERVNALLPWASYEAENSRILRRWCRRSRLLPTLWARPLFMDYGVLRRLFAWRHPLLARRLREGGVTISIGGNRFARFMLALAPDAAMLEEGSNTYRIIGNSKSRAATLERWFKTLMLYPPPVELDARGGALWAVRPQALHPSLKRARRIKALPLKEILASMGKEDKDRLLAVLLGQTLRIEGGAGLIVTTPLHRFGITPQQQVEVYKRLAARHLSAGLKWYLKPHPADRVDWAALNSGFHVLPAQFPLEALGLLPGIAFKEGLSLCSTVMYTCPFIETKIQIFKNTNALSRDNILRAAALG